MKVGSNGTKVSEVTMIAGKIIVQLGVLPAQELQLVQAACERLLGNTMLPAGPCFDHLAMASNSHCSYRAFAKSKHFKTWLSNEAEIILFIEQNWPYASKVTMNALKHFLFNMLADDLRRRKITITIGVMARQAGCIPGLFERNFPGYLGAGLAPVVLMSMVSRNGSKGGSNGHL